MAIEMPLCLAYVAVRKILFPVDNSEPYKAIVSYVEEMRCSASAQETG
jgi:hypothetical protein